MNREKLIGTWRLITFEFKKDNGETIYPFGAEAVGSIIYTESGHYSAQLMRKDRQMIGAKDQFKATDEEARSNFEGCISYFGTYEIDENAKIITHHVAGSIFPNMQGRDQKRMFELRRDQLQLITQPINLDGEKAVGILIWERQKTK